MTTVLLILLLGVLPGLLMTLYGVGQLRTYLKLRGADPVRIRDLNPPSGPVELEGTARAHEEMSQSPFTDEESLICQWEIEEYRHDPSDDDYEWDEIASGEMIHPFVLGDGTGTVLVEPAEASLYMQSTETIEVDGHESPPSEVAQFLQATAEADAHSARERRYHESRLGTVDKAHVMGSVRPAPDAEDVDAVVGLDSAGDGSFVSTVVDAFRAEDFTISNAGEEEAEREVLKYAAIFLGVGLVFLVSSGVLMVV